jgi:outer membrane biosynthesis protein TonB
MWMEERIGKRINIERIEEALGTGPDTISTACPYCLVMLGDAISAKKSSGEASESLEIVDVATLLARSVAPAGPAAGPVPAAEPTPAAEPASAGEPVEPTSAAEPAPPAGPVPPAADG